MYKAKKLIFIKQKGTTAKSDSSLKSSNYFKKVTVIPLPRTVTKKGTIRYCRTVVLKSNIGKNESNRHRFSD